MVVSYSEIMDLGIPYSLRYSTSSVDLRQVQKEGGRQFTLQYLYHIFQNEAIEYKLFLHYYSRELMLAKAIFL